MYGLLAELGKLSCLAPGRDVAHPKFDPFEHNLLCSELKQLYVLSTRAKDCILFWESNGDVARPMLDYWLSHQLVEEKPMGPDVRSMMQRSSSPAEWAKRASEFFNGCNVGGRGGFFRYHC